LPIFVLSLLLWAAGSGTTWAQAEHGGQEHAGQATAPAAPAAPEAEEEPEYAFGTVKSVSKDQLVVTEFDYDTGEEKEVAYSIDPKAEISGVNSLQEVASGDEVDVDYLVKDGKNVAVALSFAKPVEAGEEG
jgi:hypothetical protein